MFWDDWVEIIVDWVEIIVVGWLIVLLLFSFVFGVQFLNITFVDNVPVKVYVNGEQVYSGTSAGVETKSTGRTTQIAIRGGFLYLFPKAYYVSDDIKIEGDKRDTLRPERESR